MSLYKGTDFVAGTPDLTNYATTSDIDTLLSTLYPVGSIYIGTQATCPLAALISGSTWTLVATDRALWGGDGTNGNTTVAAGLPNITGSYYEELMNPSETGTGALEVNATAANRGNTTGNYGYGFISFDASRSSSIYGQSNTVQPPAYVVNIWRRTA